VPPSPASNGQPSAPPPERKSAKPKRDSEEVQRQTLIGAIASELLTQTSDGGMHWKPGAKAHCAQAFGTFRWGDVKALPLDRLQLGYVALRKILDGLKAPAQPEPAEADEASDDTQVARHHPTPSWTPEQDALRRDALSWGLPEHEVDHVLQRHRSLVTARNLLVQGAELRKRQAAEPLLASAS